MPFLNRLFNRQEPSRDVAKQRLKQVLVQDRANVSPQFKEQVRARLTRVLSELMDVDESNTEISFSQAGGSIQLVASVPIRQMKRNPGMGR